MVQDLFRRADLVLALSDRWKEGLECRVPMTDCQTLYNGVEPAELQAAVSDPAEHRSSFLMLGRLGKRKGTYDLIAAAELALRKAPGLRFCLAGDGEVEQVRALVKEKGLEEQIAVPGWIGREEKLRRLRDAATVVLPSYHEGLPVSLLEGMAAGKAIISTTVGAIPEVIGAENGILIAPGDVPALADALLRCGGSPELLAGMGERNRQKVEQI